MVRKLMFYLKGHDRPVSITDTDTSQTLEQLRSLIELSLKGDQISNFETENKELKDILICRSFSIDAIHIVEHPEKKRSLDEEEKRIENNIDLHEIIKGLSENEELVEEENSGVLEKEEPIVDDNEPIIIIEDQTKNEEEKLNEETFEKGENND